MSPTRIRTPSRASHEAVRHIALIADGNRRWARARGRPVCDGYQAGANTLMARVGDAIELGVEQLTLYAFSTENWSRPSDEVHEFFSIVAHRVAQETGALHARGIRLRFIGRDEGVGPELRARIRWAEQMTSANRQLALYLAFNYGGRSEILEAARRFEGTTEEEFSRLLYAPEMLDPDLVIRTGGERRLSNFLLWQSASSQLVFRDELWPEFTRECMEQSLRDFAASRHGCPRAGPSEICDVSSN